MPLGMRSNSRTFQRTYRTGLCGASSVGRRCLQCSRNLCRVVRLFIATRTLSLRVCGVAHILPQILTSLVLPSQHYETLLPFRRTELCEVPPDGVVYCANIIHPSIWCGSKTRENPNYYVSLKTFSLGDFERPYS